MQTRTGVVNTGMQSTEKQEVDVKMTSQIEEEQTTGERERGLKHQKLAHCKRDVL